MQTDGLPTAQFSVMADRPLTFSSAKRLGWHVHCQRTERVSISFPDGLVHALADGCTIVVVPKTGSHFRELTVAARHLPHLGAAAHARRDSLSRPCVPVRSRKCSHAPVDTTSHRIRKHAKQFDHLVRTGLRARHNSRRRAHLKTPRDPK
jgi:hypothetical protein